MPLIKVQSSVDSLPPAQVTALLKQLSANLSKHLGKPESYVMTAFESGVPMTFGGTPEPTCYVEIKNVGQISPAQTQAMSRDFCEHLEKALGIAANRIYIEFNASQGAMWGWNGSTFG